MKKMTLAILLTLSLNANAGLLSFFDITKFGQALLLIVDGMNENLEKIRIYQHEKMDVTIQWDRMCRITAGLNQSTVELNTILTTFNFDTKTCLPLTTALQLQTDIIANCEKFNSEPVAVNTDYVLGHFMTSIEAVKKIKSECLKK